MLKLSAGLIGLLFTPALFAQSLCSSPTLYDFTVYSIGDVEVQQSDYQGMTGVGGNIFAKNFQFNSNTKNCLALAVAKDAGIVSGDMNGNVESLGKVSLTLVGSNGDIVATSANISFSGIDGSLTTSEFPELFSARIGKKNRSNQLIFEVNHKAIEQELLQESLRLSDGSSNSPAIIRSNGTLTIDLKKQGNRIYLLRPTDLSNAKRIFISGDEKSVATINVPGERLILRDQDFVLSDKICTGNITWNFYQAKFLSITKTHNAHFGMPGIVMAPLARVEFNEALITGALYAGEIVTSVVPITNLNAGQVDRGCPQVTN